jgi:UrcA family protein
MQRMLLAIAVGFAGAASPAFADERYQVRIAYGDLDLSTQDGADAMLDRIRDAARDTCDLGRSVDVQPRVRACVEDFTQIALAELNHASVTQRFFARRGEGAVTVAAR